MDEIEVAEWFENNFNKIRGKSSVRVAPAGRNAKIYGFVLEQAGLWIISCLYLGPRNGLTEIILVLDPSQKIAVDKVLFAYENRISGMLYTLKEIRRTIREGADIDELCQQQLRGILGELTTLDKDQIKKRINMKIGQFTGSSVVSSKTLQFIRHMS